VGTAHQSQLKMSKYIRAYSPGACYFFSVVTYQRRRILTDAPNREFLRLAIKQVQSEYPFAIDAWVLMPDHMHCMWTLPEGDADFSKRWGLIKAGFSKQVNAFSDRSEIRSASREKHRESTLWQRRFWEHRIRDQEDFNRHIDYIHWNPVKHGLVERVVDWPYSSFHRYLKAGVYALDWGVREKDFDHQDYGELS
jgi:putative transposase